jgi:hypothetical protein
MSSTLVGELTRRDYWDINNLTTVPSDAPYPYSSLQIFGFVLIFTLTGFAFALCCIRVYGRTLVGSFGWGRSMDRGVLDCLMLSFADMAG